MDFTPLGWSDIAVAITTFISSLLVRERRLIEEIERYRALPLREQIEALQREARFLNFLFKISFPLHIFCYVLGAVYFSVLSQMNEVRLFIVTLTAGAALVILGLFIFLGILRPALNIRRQISAYTEKVRL